VKRFVCAALCGILCFGFLGCSAKRTHESDGKLKVVATLFPYYDFVRQVGGEDVDVTLLVPAGRETHSFEPTPLDVITVSEAQVFVYNGGESEFWVDRVLESAGGDIPYILCGMDLIDDALEEEAIVDGQVVTEETHDHEHDHDEEEEEYDEHIWTSPVVAKTLCRGICDTLCGADETHAEVYRQRTEAYLAELDALDEQFRRAVAAGDHQQLVFGDRFPLLYFCREYGLSYSAAFHGCSSDTEPSLRTMKNLIDKVEKEKIPVIYTIELSSGKVAAAISEATGASVRTFHSCQNVTRQEFDAGETYLSLMEKNVQVLREGLGA